MLAPIQIMVCGEREIPQVLQQCAKAGRAVGNVISVRSNPNETRATLRTFETTFAAVPADHLSHANPQRLLLLCADTESERHAKAPSDRMVQTAISFAQHHWTTSEQKTLLVQCALGWSRSAATALAIKTAFRKAHDAAFSPESCADWLAQTRPQATPNRMIVALADEMLGLSGDLVRAVERQPRLKANYRKTRVPRGVFNLALRLLR